MSTYALTMYRYIHKLDGKEYKVGNAFSFCLKPIKKKNILQTYGIPQDKNASKHCILRTILLPTFVFWYIFQKLGKKKIYNCFLKSLEKLKT